MDFLDHHDLFLLEKVFEKMGLGFNSGPLLFDGKDVIVLAIDFSNEADNKYGFFIFDLLGKFLKLKLEVLE